MQITATLDSDPRIGFTASAVRKRGGPPVTTAPAQLVLSNGDTMTTALPTDPDVCKRVVEDFKFDAHFHWGLDLTEVRWT